MTSKLSWHTMGDPTAVQDVLRASGAKIAKVFDYESPDAINLIKGIVPLVIYRKYVDANYDSISPDAFVAALPDKLFGLGMVWEGINEPVISTVAQAQSLSAWYVRFAELMHARGERVAAYSFSTGNPPLDLVPYLADGAAACDWIALHEYAKPGPDYSQIGRYKDFLNALPAYARRQVLITETGADAGGCSDCGWMGSIWNLTPAQYLAALQNIDLRYGGDDWLAGATIFQYGGGKPWQTFNVASISKSISFYIASQGGGNIPPMPTVTYPRETKSVPADPYLASFPRPVGDNGRGLHFILDTRPSQVAEYVPRYKALKLKWATVYGGDENVTTYAAQQLLQGAGTYSVIRVEARLGAPKAVSFWDALTRKMIALGLPPYVQIFNEPEIEWDTPAHFAQMWNVRAAVVVAAGGYPGLQTMSQEYFNAAVDGMTQAVKDRFVFIQHNYGANHPPQYPYNKGLTPLEDDTCALRFLATAEWAKQKLGRVMPILGGEGGWQWQNADDKSLPPLSAQQWIDWNYAAFEWFRSGLIPGPDGTLQSLPDYVFSINPWLAYAANWYSDSWYFGMNADQKQSLLDKLASDAPYVRQFGTNAPPVPVVSFTLTPQSIAVGQSAVLAWNCANVKEIYLNGQGVTGQESRTITPTSAGQMSFVLHVIYPDGSAHDWTQVLTVTGTTPPPPPVAIVDARCPWVTYEQGTQYELIYVKYRDAVPVDFPQSQKGTNIWIRIEDEAGNGLTNELVELHNGGVAPQWTIYGNTAFTMYDNAFYPDRGQVGPYSVWIGDGLKVKGMGLPVDFHVEYVILVTKR